MTDNGSLTALADLLHSAAALPDTGAGGGRRRDANSGHARVPRYVCPLHGARLRGAPGGWRRCVAPDCEQEGSKWYRWQQFSLLSDQKAAHTVVAGKKSSV